MKKNCVAATAQCEVTVRLVFIDFIQKDLSKFECLSIPILPNNFANECRFIMQVLSYIQSVDKQLNSVLHRPGNNASAFAWYLALQLPNDSSYSAKNVGAMGHEVPYAGMNLPSAPKASLYVQHKHFMQNTIQSIGLHSAEQPSILIQFYNSLQPQTLHCTRQEQKLPNDVIKNSPMLVQNTFKTFIEQNPSAVFNGSEHQFQSYQNINEDQSEDNSRPYEAASALPDNNFVDATFANIKQAMSFQV